MSSRSINVMSELNRLISDGVITEAGLQAMTGIDPATLRAALSDEANATALIGGGQPLLTDDETMRISVLSAQLTEGMTVNDDERLTAILESLTAALHLSPSNIARLTGIDVEDIDRVIRDPRSVSSDTRYSIALRCSYLINAVNRAQGQ